MELVVCLPEDNEHAGARWVHSLTGRVLGCREIGVC